MNKIIKFLISLNDIEINIFDTSYNKDNPYNGKLYNVVNLMNKEYEHRELRRIWNILTEKNVSKNNSQKFKITIDGYRERNITLKIKDLSNLSKVYKLIKHVYPNYKYKLLTIYPFGKWVDVIWKDRNYPLIDIKLETTVTEFPEELISENCGFEKELSTSYKYVCN